MLYFQPSHQFRTLPLWMPLSLVLLPNRHIFNHAPPRAVMAQLFLPHVGRPQIAGSMNVCPRIGAIQESTFIVSITRPISTPKPKATKEIRPMMFFKTSGLYNVPVWYTSPVAYGVPHHDVEIILKLICTGFCRAWLDRLTDQCSGGRGKVGPVRGISPNAKWRDIYQVCLLKGIYYIGLHV